MYTLNDISVDNPPTDVIKKVSVLRSGLKTGKQKCDIDSAADFEATNPIADVSTMMMM